MPKPNSSRLIGGVTQSKMGVTCADSSSIFYAFGGGGVYHVADQLGISSATPVLRSTFFGYYPGGGALHGRFFAEAKWSHVFSPTPIASITCP
jgi:hypothetical protein